MKIRKLKQTQGNKMVVYNYSKGNLKILKDVTSKREIRLLQIRIKTKNQVLGIRNTNSPDTFTGQKWEHWMFQ